MTKNDKVENKRVKIEDTNQNNKRNGDCQERKEQLKMARTTAK